MMTKEPEKIYHIYDIKVKATVPCSLSYRVRAETPEEALKLIERQIPNGFEPVIAKRKLISATVYDGGTIQVKATKKYQ